MKKIMLAAFASLLLAAPAFAGDTKTETTTEQGADGSTTKKSKKSKKNADGSKTEKTETTETPAK